jgi:hypothetical protein
LNPARDNLWFTFLLRRPAWFSNFPPDDEIVKALKVLERATLMGLSPSGRADDFVLIDRILCEERPGLPHDKRQVAVDHLRNSRGADLADCIGWGWKEPNTHIFLPQIAATFESVRYIHVIRNGLDMAFSTNQRQVHSWGRFLGVVQKDGMALGPSEALDYWIAANRRAVKLGGSLLKDRFHVIRYEDLCVNLDDEIGRLGQFLGVDVPAERAASIAKLVQPAATIERYRNFDMTQFSQSQIEAVRQFGFNIDPA